VTRPEFQQLSQDRIVDAQALLLAKRWSGAYYLAGYAVECGLKACILKYVAAHLEVIFKKKRFQADCWTHDFDTLIKQAELDLDWKAERDKSSDFARNWLTISDWSEDSRYQSKTQAEAESLFDAVTHPTDGVLTWIMNHW